MKNSPNPIFFFMHEVGMEINLKVAGLVLFWKSFEEKKKKFSYCPQSFSPWNKVNTLSFTMGQLKIKKVLTYPV